MARTTSTRNKTGPASEWAGSFEEWAGRAGPHRATLKSGQRIEFRLMGLGELTLRGLLPTELRDLVSLDVLNKSHGGIAAVIADDIVASTQSDEGQELLERHLAELYALNKELAAAALVAPKLTAAQLDEIPFEDLEEIVRLVTGQQPFDSRGVRVGVEPLDTFARFHHHHGLDTAPENCPGCTQLADEFSTLHLGPL